MRKVTWKRASGAGVEAVASGGRESAAAASLARSPSAPAAAPAPPFDDDVDAGGGEENGWGTFGGGGGGEGIEGWRIMPAGSAAAAAAGADDSTPPAPPIPEPVTLLLRSWLWKSGGSGCVDEGVGGVLDEKKPAGMEAFPTGSRSQPSMHLDDSRVRAYVACAAKSQNNGTGGRQA